MRETNHLRKYANEAGKQMRGPKKSRRISSGDLSAWNHCANCGYMRMSHDPKSKDYEFYRKEGMCGKFVAGQAERGQ